jgi:hypothetical protein
MSDYNSTSLFSRWLATKRRTASTHIDKIESGIYPAQASGLMSDIRARSFRNSALINSGVHLYLIGAASAASVFPRFTNGLTQDGEINRT